MAWSERDWAEWVRMGVEGKNTSRPPTWKVTPNEQKRVDEKGMLQRISIDTQVADFARVLAFAEPFEITGRL
jgi:hypothetical protein